MTPRQPSAHVSILVEALNALDRMHAQEREGWLADKGHIHRECLKVKIPEHRGTQRVGEPAPASKSGGWLRRLRAAGVRFHGQHWVVDTRHSCAALLASVDAPRWVVFDTSAQQMRMISGFAHDRVIEGVAENCLRGWLWHGVVEPDHWPGLHRELLDALATHGITTFSRITCTPAGALALEKALRLIGEGTSGRPAGTQRYLALEPMPACPACDVAWSATQGPWSWTLDSGDVATARQFIFHRVTATSPCDFVAPDITAILVSTRILIDDDAEGRQARWRWWLELRQRAGEVHVPLIWVHDGELSALARRLDEACKDSKTGSPAPLDPWMPEACVLHDVFGIGLVLSHVDDDEPVGLHGTAVARAIAQLRPRVDITADPIAAHCARIIEWWMDTALRHGWPVAVDARDDAAVSSVRCHHIPGTQTLRLHFAAPVLSDRFVRGAWLRGIVPTRHGSRCVGLTFQGMLSRKHLDDALERVGAVLDALATGAEMLPMSERKPHRAAAPALEIRALRPDDWPAIMTVEHEVYEPARVADEATLRRFAATGIALVAAERDSGLDAGEILGFCLGGPLEDYGDQKGIALDEHFGAHDTFYSANVAVSPRARGRGVGRALKIAQLKAARTRGFRFASGRNQVFATDEMIGLNRSLGAYNVRILADVYGPDLPAYYYRIPLQAPARDGFDGDDRDDFAHGIEAPLGPAPAILDTRELVGPAACTLDLADWTTPDVVQCCEYLSLLRPAETSGLFLTSSRDEAMALALTALHRVRPRAHVVLGLQGAYFGHGAALTRALGDDLGAGHLPHPHVHGLEVTKQALAAAILRFSSERCLAFVCESVGERSGWCLHPSELAELAALCRAHGIGVVVSETAAGGFRSGNGMWGLQRSSARVRPDAVIWYAGNDVAPVFVSADMAVPAEFPCISRGVSELALLRVHAQLQVAAQLELGPRMRALEATLCAVTRRLEGAPTENQIQLGGLGLYRTLRFPAPHRADKVAAAARARGLRLGKGQPDTLIFAPRLDADMDALGASLLNRLWDAIHETMCEPRS